MTFMNWDPFREFEMLRRQVERVFEEFVDEDRPLFRFPFLPGLFAETHPLLNVRSDKDNIYVDALAPGLNTETLDISVEQGTLRITGEKAPLSKEIKPEDFHRRERAEGRFTRTLRLPVEVNSEKVNAEYKNGLLRITLPKAEAAKPKQIQIKVA